MPRARAKPKQNGGGPATAGELTQHPRNPRRVTDQALAELGRSMRELGDVGSIVFNRRTGRLVGGNQRSRNLPSDAPVHILKRFEPATEAGTVAVGAVELEGELFAYREVDWSEEREAAAMVRANNPAGRWDDELLTQLLAELQGSGEDLTLTGFSEAQLAELLAATSPNGARPAGPSLADRFVVPPFSVLDARQGYWQDRKREWLALGIESEIGRGAEALGFSQTVKQSW